MSFGAESVETAKATETALSASDLARTCPSMRVCLLQGPVEINKVGRRDSDRRREALARSFAAELFTQGIPVVIIVPPLYADVAAQVAAAIATALRARPVAGTREMQRAVERARNLLTGTEGGTAPADWERAYDMSLYAEADWDGSWRD
jgi:hypothetical protein